MTSGAPGSPDTTRSGTANSLRARRAVRTDAALGGSSGEHAVRSGGRLVRRLTPAAILARAGRVRFPVSAPSWPESVPRPAPTPELGVYYDTAWSRRYPVRLARAVVLDNVARPLARVLASPLIRGDESLVGLEAPVIFAANHASHADTPLLLSCLPLRFRHRTVVAAAADYFFDRRWKADTWSFLLAAIPFERTKVNRRSADLAAELLEEDWNLVIFPEGGRSPDGWAQSFHPGGAAYLATRSGRPVVPVHLDGTRHILPKGRSGIRPDPDHSHLRYAPVGRGRGERPTLQRPHRGGGGHHGQRGRIRLVDGAAAGRSRDHTGPAGTRCRRVAPLVGIGRRTRAPRPRRGDPTPTGPGSPAESPQVASMVRRPARAVTEASDRTRPGRATSLVRHGPGPPRRQALAPEGRLVGIVQRCQRRPVPIRVERAQPNKRSASSVLRARSGPCR